jgi:DNA-binding Lrp family transcriptional regulator
VNLDRVDVAILRAVQADARLSLREIARAARVSAPTVAARLATLEQLGVVRGYQASIDPEHLGETRVHIVVKARLQTAEVTARDIASMDRIRRVTVARGGRILAEATASSGSEIDAVLDGIAALPGVVDLDHHVGVRTIKDEPVAILPDGLSASLACFECRKPIEGEPVRIRLDGRDHYLCCASCERLYREKYGRIKAAA